MNVQNGISPLGGVLVLALLSGCAAPTPDADSAVEAGETHVRLSAAQLTAAEITTVTVQLDSLHPTLSVPGSVQLPDTAQVAVGSIVEGLVMSVSVLPGQVVRPGETLVEIHSHELLTAQRDLTAAHAVMAQYRAALRRSEQLLGAGAVSIEEVERRQADFVASEAELDRAEEMVAHLHPSMDGNVQVTAPRGGTIFTVSARPGQAVLPGTPLVEMGSIDVLWVTAFVPESSARAAEPGQVVSVRFGPGSNDAVRALLVGMGSHVDPSNRSVEMRFELETVPTGVRPGSFAAVEVASDAPFQGMELSDEAVVSLGADDVVFVADGVGAFRPVAVEALPLGAGTIAVRGLPPGSDVVTRGAFFLKAAAEQAGVTAEGRGS